MTMAVPGVEDLGDMGTAAWAAQASWSSLNCDISAYRWSNLNVLQRVASWPMCDAVVPF